MKWFRGESGSSPIYLVLISALVMTIVLAIIFALAPTLAVQTTDRAVSLLQSQGYTVLASGLLDQNLVPSADNTYDLGSPSNRWRSLYITSNSLHLGDITIEAVGSTLKIGDAVVLTLPVNGISGQVLSLDSSGSPIWTSIVGTQGETGESAYQLAVDNGFIGTESDWLASLVGAKGEQGLQGIQGIQGDKGETGAQGLQGIQGLKGDTGATGAQGLQGIQGEIGLTGAKGDKGDTGAQGIQGIAGYTPIKGVDYFDGSQGIQGIQGATGATGAKGDTGSQGIQGIQGEKGDTGAQGIQGVKGDTGAQGLQGIQGLKGDKGDTGDNGLNYISTASTTNGTGFVKGNGSAISFDNSTYLTGNQSISLGGILSGSGTTSITASAASGYYMPTTSDQTTWNGKLSSVVADSPLSGSGTSGSHLTIDLSAYETTSALASWAGSSNIVTVGNVSGGTYNKVTITAPATSSTLTLAQGSSLITSGAYAITLTSTGTTGVTLPTSGTLYSSATEVPNTNIPNGINNGNSAAQSQVVVAGTYYYITKSNLTMPASAIAGMKVGTRFVWRVAMTKTTAGTAAFSICIYRGTNGSTSDTRDVTQSVGTSTAVADTMYVDVQITVTGTGASGSYYWTICPINRATTSTGFSVPAGSTGVFSGTVSGVAMNTASLQFGLGFMNTTGTPTIAIPFITANAYNMD